MPSLVQLSRYNATQEGTIREIVDARPEDRPKMLMNWAIARLSHFGPTDDACVNTLREYVETGEIKMPVEIDPAR